MLTAEQIAQARQLLAAGDDVKDEALPSLLLASLTKAPKAADLETARTNLSRVQGELDQAREGLKNKAMPEVDPDAMDAAVENVTTKLSLLVERGRITPSVKDKLAAVLLGTDKSRPAICLSRKAATHVGLAGPLAAAVIEALEGNDAAQLAKLAGTKTGPQVKLSRENPDGTEDHKIDAAELKARAAAL